LRLAVVASKSGTSDTNGLTGIAIIIHGIIDMAKPTSVDTGQTELFEVHQEVSGIRVDSKSSRAL
jgi:hypothetical protein